MKTLAFIIAAGFVAAIILFAWGADAHEVAGMQYPARCCGGMDCAPLEGVNAVQRRVDGWFIASSGETIPFDKTDESQDLRFHRCVKPDNTTRCLFAPSSGT